MVAADYHPERNPTNRARFDVPIVQGLDRDIYKDDRGRSKCAIWEFRKKKHVLE